MEMIETESNVVVLNEQPEFSAAEQENVSASYFVLCEENDNSLFGQNVYEYQVAGMSLLNWVTRACDSAPVILKVSPEDSVLEVIKPYLNGSEYSVVLYASTPLLNKGHLKDLLGFVSRKHMNACRLKKGYVLKNDYIVGVDDLYSIDTYDFASNDFFEVKNHGDLSLVQEILEKKVLSYHKKNGVYFENESQVAIDATTEIGYASVVSAGARVLNHSSVATNVKIGANAVVSNSKLGEDVVVGLGSVVEGCVVKNGVVIGDGVVLKNSVIGNNVVIGTGAMIVDSGIKDEACLGDMVRLSNARLGENVHVGKLTQILGNDEPSIIAKNSLVGSNAQIVDSKIAESSEIEANKIVVKNKKVN